MKTLFFVMITFILFSCNKDDESDLFSDLNDKSFELEANQILNDNLNASFPSDELAESDYRNIDSRIIGHISFSDNEKSISITPIINHLYPNETLSGNLESKKGATTTYYIDYWAGGRFILTKTDNLYMFELTMFGSGVPIVSSERGILKPAALYICH